MVQSLLSKMMRQNFFLFSFVFIAFVCKTKALQEFEENSHGGLQGLNYGPGPLVQQTNGEIWPKPQSQAQQDGTFHTFDVGNFSFEVSPY